MANPVNSTVAQRLDEAAALLHEQGANPFRVRAYRRAADTLRRIELPVTAILEREGLDGLERLPNVGEQLARHIQTLVESGRLPMLDRLRGEVDPEALLASVPGIGKKTAARLHHDLHLDTLEELEAAAHDGRLREVEGFGAKRVAGVIDSLASRLQRVRRQRWPRSLEEEPAVAELLDVDREYREKSQRGELRKIAPRRFNPTAAEWLPILHTVRGERHYTAMFSNTARAHRLGRTDDWVVIYCDDEDHDRQYTVVTSREGPSAGRRVVRGREAELVHSSAAANF